jgi:hypothetical protein
MIKDANYSLLTYRSIRLYFRVELYILLMRRTLLLDLAATWSCAVVFDILVFVMTVAKAIMVRRSGDRKLINILLRDGKCTFLTVSFLINIVHQVPRTSCMSYSKLPEC